MRADVVVVVKVVQPHHNNRVCFGQVNYTLQINESIRYNNTYNDSKVKYRKKCCCSCIMYYPNIGNHLSDDKVIS